MYIHHMPNFIDQLRVEQLVKEAEEGTKLGSDASTSEVGVEEDGASEVGTSNSTERLDGKQESGGSENGEGGDGSTAPPPAIKKVCLFFTKKAQ